MSGDFNGDNKDDVMARSATTGELWLYPGTGSFTTDAILGQPIRVGTGWSQFDLIFSGDFNRDGKSDIVGRRPSDGTLWVYPGTGSFVTDQVLSAPTRIGVGWNQFSAIFTGDFNQDGKSDVVARGAADNVLVVYPGTGALTTDAVVLPPTRVGVGWGDLGLFSSGDFNQDGKSDIVARRISDGVLLLWPGTGSLTTDRVVNPGIQVGIGWGVMNALTAGDFNQDGKSDVVVRSTTDATLWMYPGTGSLTPNQILTSPKRVGIGWGGMDRIS
ncbi:VCBS repeat-containing protein [Asanoa iriomotensis]|uniref:FG-GAP repeat domain-containing protein n=3 Tax=Asanoa iriomotensis TaxID=234613 RepID=UPI0031DA2201